MVEEGIFLPLASGMMFMNYFPALSGSSYKLASAICTLSGTMGKIIAIVKSLDTVKGCLVEGGCFVVPGLPREQWIFTLISSMVGGVIVGFAGIPRKEGQVFAWQWALIMSPLWGILFIAFGIGPVVTRTSDWLPLFRNIMGFVLGAVVAYLSPMFSQSTSSSET